MLRPIAFVAALLYPIYDVDAVSSLRSELQPQSHCQFERDSILQRGITDFDGGSSGAIRNRGESVRDGYGAADKGVAALRDFTSARAMKTGTTIAGVVFEGGVVLGADTRATGGKTVCDRNCDKIHILAANMACCGAGTSADAVRVTEGVRIALLKMAGEMQACLPSQATSLRRAGPKGDEAVTRDSAVGAVQRKYLQVTAAAFLLKRHLFRHKGTVSAALVLGGVDALGSHIFQIHEGGGLAKVAFTAMGSGSLAALSELERGHREGMSERDAKQLVLSAIAAGIENDLGSGSNIDVCVITAARGVEHQRGAWVDPGIQPRFDESGASSAENTPQREADTWNGEEGPGMIAQTTMSRSTADLSVEGPTDPIRSKTKNSELETRDEVGGKDGSRAWVGNVTRRGRGKKVVKVDDDGVGLWSFRCSALDDKVEVL